MLLREIKHDPRGRADNAINRQRMVATLLGDSGLGLGQKIITKRRGQGERARDCQAVEGGF